MRPEQVPFLKVRDRLRKRSSRKSVPTLSDEPAFLRALISVDQFRVSYCTPRPTRRTYPHGLSLRKASDHQRSYS